MPDAEFEEIVAAVELPSDGERPTLHFGDDIEEWVSALHATGALAP
jgi:hypothetical protein